MLERRRDPDAGVPPRASYSKAGQPRAMRRPGLSASRFPRSACRAESRRERAVLWLGPDEWLLLAPAGEGTHDCALENTLAGQPHSLVDVTHRQVALSVVGRGARDLLASGVRSISRPSVPGRHVHQDALRQGGGRFVAAERRGVPSGVGRSFSGYVLGWLRKHNEGD
jgi:sarcosine oxidase subunit gamma